MDTDPRIAKLMKRLLSVIEIAKCWRTVAITEIEKRKKAEAELARFRDVAERNAIGILSVYNGEKIRK